MKHCPLSRRTIGLPREYFPADLHPGVRAGCTAAIARLKDLGARIVEVSLPHARFAVPTYYIIAPAEAAANLARFDGARYGARVAAEGDVRALYRATRGKGFGPEVRRRIASETRLDSLRATIRASARVSTLDEVLSALDETSA